MNTFKTTILLALLTGLLIAVGGAFGGSNGAMIMLVISLGMNFFAYWFSDTMVLKAYNAREIAKEDAPELFNLVAKLARNANLPMPKVCIIQSEVPNAFATGRNPEHAAVAVTTGIMRALDYNELSGVLAHELSHVEHRDTLISTVAASIAGVISMIASIAQWSAILGTRSSEENNGGILGALFTALIAPIAAMLIQMAISRSREYAADERGGEICENPLYLASALEKIDYFAKNARPLQDATPATAHMFIINPLAGVKENFASLFSTHPETKERIRRLREQASMMRIHA